MLDLFAVVLSALFLLGILLPMVALYVLFMGIYLLVVNPLKWALGIALHGIESEPMELA